MSWGIWEKYASLKYFLGGLESRNKVIAYAG